MFRTGNTQGKIYQVVHPLDDLPETKRSADGLGPIHMSRSVRISLIALRSYLGLILGLAVYRIAVLIAHAVKP